MILDEDARSVALAPWLQWQFGEQRRAWLALMAQHVPYVSPWPARRSRKRRPIPGTRDGFADEG